jgi:2-phosphosulfolactate phosphatase
MQQAYRQRGYQVRFDWGLAGVEAIAEHADVVVVVDVLSFTTTVSVALDAGTVVLPYRWKDHTAQRYARERGAVLAVDRSQARGGEISLSPATLRAAESPPARLVLPSPNGSTIAHRLGSHAVACVAACLRNAQAVAAWICTNYELATITVAVIAAGEQWPDGGLRPAVEDLWGAGAVIADLLARGWHTLSPEAQLAASGYGAIRGKPQDALLGCASGRELVEHGYRADVDIAAEGDQSDTVPLLAGGRFTNADAC